MGPRKRHLISRALIIFLITGLVFTPFAVLFAARPASAVITVGVNGDWTVSGTNMFDGIIFKVDGNVVINAGALLEIRNGGLIFLEDSAHIYTLTVNAGGNLVLDNSILSTEPNQLSDYLKLDVIVNGGLTLRNNAVLKHPGTLTVSGSMDVYDSTITGFTPPEIANFNLDPADNDDAPAMTFSGTVVIAGSTVSRLYENTASPGPDPRYNITTQGTARLTIIDSFVGVDYLNSATAHNVIAARGSSTVYLYNMTLDEVQSAQATPSLWIPALVPVGNASAFYLHRWLDATVADRFGSAIEGARIESQVLPTGAVATYPNNGGALVPSLILLNYLGRTDANFNVTDFFGRARVPLLTEWINQAVFDPSTPNSAFDGNYRIRASQGGVSALRDIAFDSYPSLGAANNTLTFRADLTGLVWPAPDNTYIWNTPMFIGFDMAVDGNIRVRANVTIEGAELSILQYGPSAGRHYLIVEGEGRLTIRDGALRSNQQLTVYVTGSGQLFTERTDVLLNSLTARGLLYSEGASVVELRDGLLDGNVEARGASAAVRNMTIIDSDLILDTSGTSRLWDPVFGGTVTLALLSDDGDRTTLDFDIRNATFDPVMSGSVVFTGTQYAQLTDVTFSGAADWWEGRIFDRAKVDFHWWLTVNAVDPLGQAVAGANITLRRLNPLTLAFVPIPAPGADDLYGGTFLPAHIEAPTGTIVYRALAQERLASQGWSNSTYQASGTIVRDGMTFSAEADIAVSLDANAAVDLVYWNWPDLSITLGDVVFTRVPVEGGAVEVRVTVRNLGMADARGAMVQLLDDGALAATALVDVSWGFSTVASLSWTPALAGIHTVTVRVLSRNDTVQNTDFDFRNNVVTLAVEVKTKPDLVLLSADNPDVVAVQGRPFTVDVLIHNLGNTAALNFEVALYLTAVAPENLLALASDVNVTGGTNTTVSILVGAQQTVGNFTLIILADASNVIPETSEANNRLDVLLQIVPPEGSIFITVPTEGQAYNQGDQIFVTGSVTTPGGQPIPDMQLTLVLRDQDGSVWDSKAVFTDQAGEYVVGLQIARDGPAGTWTITAVAQAGTIGAATRRISVAEVVPWYETKVPFVNLPLWMVLAAVGAFLLVVFAVGAYMRSFGLGRLVECGECGAFIPESSETCPKCGTEFEQEMAKCSSCHAWIPADVKKCPECGVEFTTGKAKSMDFKERMRKQYEGIVNKYRAEAARALGHRPSEKEFQEWWRRQPTFVTFETWLKEEEEMRKMGSKPCPRCNSLNSITARICHRCGTLMSGEATPPGAPPGPGGPPGGDPFPGPPLEPPAGGPPAPPGEKRKVLKRIVKKPFGKRKAKK